MKPVVVRGVSDNLSGDALARSIREVLLDATGQLDWLRKGDTVLLKPALNSPDPYPATTHPLALDVVSEILMEHGAKVVIGDQSGIEHVLHHPAGVIRGSSRENFARSGMGRRGDPRFVSFEEGGWDEGFFHHQSANTKSWRDGFFITTWTQKADHIICLPRVSTHSQAGATLGFKCMVGMLREDSRMEFHANGPYNRFITSAARGSTLHAEDDGSGFFFEKIVEISDAVRDKLRLTLFVATKAQATFGPDRIGVRVGPVGLCRAHVTDLKPGLVFASADPVAAEAFALALIKEIKQSVPFLPRLTERFFLSGNRNVKDVSGIPVREHPYIRHATAIGLGEMSGDIHFSGVPDTMQDRIRANLS
jgi:uncharacterized protein (DUF362 family)